MRARLAATAAGLSAAFNLGIVASLAHLGAIEVPDDLHRAHPVRPSVVEPPPPPARTSDRAPTPNPAPTAAQVPAAREPPPLALPPMATRTAAFTGRLPFRGTDWAFDRGFDALVERDPRGGAELPSRRPQIVRTPDLSPYYPRTAQQSGVTGRSIIRVEVDARGVAHRVEVLQSEPSGVFEEAARRAGRAFRFAPALERGRPVRATTRVELVWSHSS